MTNGEISFKSQNELIQTLIEKGEDINAFHSSGQTLLIAMARKADIEAIKTLLDAGANLEQRDFYDKTALMHAVETGQEQVANLLIDAGANVNAKNYQGRTALMYAAHKLHPGIVDQLLDAGADVNITDDTGYSALDHLSRKKQTAIRDSCLNHLKKHEAKYGSEIINIKENWFNKVASFDEFEELSNLRSHPVIVSVISFFFILMLTATSSLVGHAFIIPSWIGLIIVGRWLLQSFPSIPKIILAIKNIITGKSRESSEVGHVKDIETMMSATTGQNNLEFVSNVLDLGSHQLKNTLITHSDQQTKKVHVENTWSRLASTGLAISIFVLYCILYGPALFRAPFLFDPTFSARFILILIIPLWVVLAHPLERQLRVGRLRRVQVEKDRLAREISNILNAEDFIEKDLPTDFALYLRAFMTTNKFIMNGMDLETILAYSIAPTLPVIALGQPGEHLGAGRIQTSDEHWQEEIIRLFENAKLIIIIPSHREGTLWEINNLKQRNYLQKTVFIMPPEMNFYGKPYSETWNKAVTSAAACGVALPNHFPKGLIFKLNDAGCLINHAPFMIEEFMQELISYSGSYEPIDTTYGDGDGDSGSDGDGSGDGANGDGDGDGGGDGGNGSELGNAFSAMIGDGGGDAGDLGDAFSAMIGDGGGNGGDLGDAFNAIFGDGGSNGGDGGGWGDGGGDGGGWGGDGGGDGGGGGGGNGGGGNGGGV